MFLPIKPINFVLIMFKYDVKASDSRKFPFPRFKPRYSKFRQQYFLKNKKIGFFSNQHSKNFTFQPKKLKNDF